MDSPAAWAFALGISMILGGLALAPWIKRQVGLGVASIGIVLSLWSGIALLGGGALREVTALHTLLFVSAVLIVFWLFSLLIPEREIVEKRDAEALAEAEQYRKAAERLEQRAEEFHELAAKLHRLLPSDESATGAQPSPAIDVDVSVEENRKQALAVWVYPSFTDPPDRTLVHAMLSGILVRNNTGNPVRIQRMWLAVLNPETGQEEWPQVSKRHNKEEVTGNLEIRARDQQSYDLDFERIFGVVIPRDQRAKYIKLAIASDAGEARFDLPEESFFYAPEKPSDPKDAQLVPMAPPLGEN